MFKVKLSLNRTVAILASLFFIVLGFGYYWQHQSVAENNINSDELAQQQPVVQQPSFPLEIPLELPTPKIEKKLRVLIVPGHEPAYGGALYKKLKERDMAVSLGNELKRQLEQDGHFQVYITRDDKSWNKTFSDYFKEQLAEILKWASAAKINFNNLIAKGKIKKPVVIVGHNLAPVNVANRLYGINKWADENDIDIVINIHLNDDDNHRYNVAGRYRGFAIYVPVPQYDNSVRSHALAKPVFAQLAKQYPVSNFDGERVGIVDEPKLIAIGANNTLKAASLVIEYGYIYEAKFTDPKFLEATLNNMATLTYQGLSDYRAQQ